MKRVIRISTPRFDPLMIESTQITENDKKNIMIFFNNNNTFSH